MRSGGRLPRRHVRARFGLGLQRLTAGFRMSRADR